MPVPVYEVLVRSFVFIRLGEFHTVFFGKAFNLSVTEHRKSRHCNHKRTDAEVFVVLAELRNGSVFVRIVHKVYVAFENLRIKFNRVLYGITVFLVFLFFEHIHKRRVVNAVHS